MHALAGERIEVDRQGGDQRLALAGAHFGDLAVVQRHAADQLHVEVAHLQRALAGLAHDGEGFRQQLVERLALRQALSEFVGLGAQRVVVQSLELRLQLIDLLRRAPVGLQQAVIATAENLVQYLGQHAALGLSWTRRPSTRCCRASARTASRHHAKGRRQVGSAFRFASSVEVAAVDEFSTRAAAVRAVPGRSLPIATPRSVPWEAPAGHPRGSVPGSAERRPPAPRSEGAAPSIGRRCQPGRWPDPAARCHLA